jgi:hypothetical protein
MKKTLITLFALTLMPGALALAQDGGGRHGDGNGGGGGFSGPGGGQPKKHSKGPKNHKNPGGGNHGGGNSNFSATHSFNNNNGSANNHGMNGGANNNTPHHFGSSAQGSNGGNGFNGAQKQVFRPGGNFGHSGRVPSNLKQMGVKHLPPTLNKSNVLTADPQHSSMVQPQMGPRGQALHASVIAPTSTNAVVIQNHMSAMNHNAAFSAQINVYNNHETVAGQYYWHSWNGTNYCHYYDSWGYHWYGWYWGNTCFWSRWYGNNWWWYDPGYARWCYWYDGYWWWQDPYLNVAYVYNNGEYTSSASNEAAAPASPSSEVDFASKDGTRTVKIIGNDAFLYDTVDTTNNKPFYLASNVKDVQYSKTDNGQPLQIMLTFNDGTSQTFDSDGNPVNNGSNAPSN